MWKQNKSGKRSVRIVSLMTLAWVVIVTSVVILRTETSSEITGGGDALLNAPEVANVCSKQSQDFTYSPVFAETTPLAKGVSLAKLGDSFSKDSLSVPTQQVPEPATMVIFGLGALPLLRKRRAKRASAGKRPSQEL